MIVGSLLRTCLHFDRFQSQTSLRCTPVGGSDALIRCSPTSNESKKQDSGLAENGARKQGWQNLLFYEFTSKDMRFCIATAASTIDTLSGYNCARDRNRYFSMVRCRTGSRLGTSTATMEKGWSKIEQPKTKTSTQQISKVQLIFIKKIQTWRRHQINNKSCNGTKIGVVWCNLVSILEK